MFDDIERTDSSPARPTEDSFAFLNRAAGVVWERQRKLIDQWYSDFPDEDLDVLHRFRSRNPGQHFAAWWELYLHALLRALGYQVTVHPTLADTKGKADFLAEREEQAFYVEAKTVFSGIAAPTRGARLRAPIEDALEAIHSTDFYVTLKFDQFGDKMPRRKQIIDSVETWLATLDPEQVRNDSRARLDQWHYFQFGEWTISLIPSVWPPPVQGCPQNPFIGARLGIGGFVNDVPKIRQAVMRKGRNYGVPDRPLLIAVLATNGFVDDRDVTNALFGSESMRVDLNTDLTTLVRNKDGVWVGENGPAGRRISAVLMGVGILPHTVATASPRLWHHYSPRFPLEANLPFAAVRAVGDQLAFQNAVVEPGEIFGLSDGWPGPEPAFPRCLHRPEDHQR